MVCFETKGRTPSWIKTIPSSEIKSNPFFTELNQPIDYAKVTAGDVIDYADTVLKQLTLQTEAIRAEANPTFDNVIVSIDKICLVLTEVFEADFTQDFRKGSGARVGD